MAEASLQATLREGKGKQAAKRLRREGMIPAILYGAGEAPTAISVNHKDFLHLLHANGRNVVVDLSIGGSKKKIKGFIYDIQHDPISGDIIHLDLKHISLTEKIHVTVPIHLTGTPEGVKTEGGILDQTMHALEIECLPTDIPDEFTMDISDLHMGDVLHVEDLDAATGDITILSDPERTVAHIAAPRIVAVEEEEEEGEGVGLLEGEEEAAEPELIGEKKDEEEEE